MFQLLRMGQMSAKPGAIMWIIACHTIYLALLAIFSMQYAFGAPADTRLPGPVSAIVERVIDGDTIAVRARIWLNQELRVNVRIARIDTPELTAKCIYERELAGKARDFVHNILYTDGQTEPVVWLSDIDHDKFGGRVLARINGRTGEDIALALVQAGLAQAYDGKKRTDWCRNLPAPDKGVTAGKIY